MPHFVAAPDYFPPKSFVLSNHAVSPPFLKMSGLENPWSLGIAGFVVAILLLYAWRCCSIQDFLSTVAGGSEILFVTAHPDDECMFFSPSIIRLGRVCSIHVLCLSAGILFLFNKRCFLSLGCVRKEIIACFKLLILLTSAY